VQRAPGIPHALHGGERSVNGSGARRGEREGVCGIEFDVLADMRRPSTPSFRDGPQDQTRNLEIPGSMLRIAPE
jgi:hypothetical protein